MADFLGLIEQVPNVIWSGVIAAMIALAGVVLSNRSNNYRLNAQLLHDASEKHRDRVEGLRREIYLQVSDEVALASNYVSSLVGGDLDNTDIRSELKGVTTALARLSLVAEAQVTGVANKLASHYGMLMMRIFQEMYPVKVIGQEINKVEARLALLSGEVTDTLKKITNLEGLEGSREEISRLKLQYEKQSLLVQTCESDLGELSESYRTHVGKSNNALLPSFYEMSKLQMELMMVIRKDLGVDTDVEGFQKQLELQWEVMRAAYADVARAIGK
ncbi:hypothetical protein [Pseudomonas chlororaphis]|uniref:hypothetical protein n=1 Tax=Pseudomonas chlororaphis TaxID=587753 RepID=UPI001472AECC|nr:hypothetical protein [Pseudomonas chlororaphis]NNB41948.1 hypothetical protein [Pseudomonas chlororaphis]